MPPHRPYLRTPERTGKKAELLAYLTECARLGKMCPKLTDLGIRLAVSAEQAYAMLGDLRTERKISWRTVYCGPQIGKVRIVTVTATGQTTIRPVYQEARPKGTLKAIKSDCDELERAKTALRRFGRFVWDAEISDGPAGRGLVKVDGVNVSAAEVLARAAPLMVRS